MQGFNTTDYTTRFAGEIKVRLRCGSAALPGAAAAARNPLRQERSRGCVPWLSGSQPRLPCGLNGKAMAGCDATVAHPRRPILVLPQSLDAGPYIAKKFEKRVDAVKARSIVHEALLQGIGLKSLVVASCAFAGCPARLFGFPHKRCPISARVHAKAVTVAYRLSAAH
jgi:hypothetical protein